MRRGPGYSRAVRWLKILLPLAAVVLLSTIFLIDDDRIDFDETLLGDLPEGLDFEEGVLSPRLAGEMEDGTPYSLRAEFAIPASGGYQLRDVTARLERPGDPVELAAGTGLYSSEDRLLVLNGGVDLTTGGGATMLTEELRFGLTDRLLQIPGDLTIMAPGMILRADSARSTRTDDGDDIVWFEGAVQLRIEPDRMAEDNP